LWRCRDYGCENYPANRQFKRGWQEATQNAVDEAARTVKNIQSVHVKRCTAKVKENTIVEYRAVVNIAFVVSR
jgi:flavin-binding protein dodecin